MDPFATDRRMTAGDSRLELIVHLPGGPPAEAKRYLMAQPFALVGRNAAADISLPDGRVGSRQLYIQQLGGRVFYVDLGNRTRICSDGKLKPSGWIAPEEPIQVGPYLLSVAADSPVPGLHSPHNPLKPGSFEASDGRGWEIEMCDGARMRYLWRVDRALTLVGRSPRCKLQPQLDSVSAFHCCIVATGSGIWVVDLLSRQGTLVNERRVRWARLDDGDRLHLGKFEMRLWSRPPDSRPGPGGAAAAETRPLGPASVSRAAGQSLLPLAPLPPTLLRQALAEPTVNRGDLFEACLMAFVGQIDLMQREMVEQYQQAMTTLIERFESQQLGQTAAIKEELEQVRELTRQLQALRDEADRPAGATPLAAAEPNPAAVPEEPAANGQPAVPVGANGTHAELWRRMSELEQQRRGRWQKIRDFLQGK